MAMTVGRVGSYMGPLCMLTVGKAGGRGLEQCFVTKELPSPPHTPAPGKLLILGAVSLGICDGVHYLTLLI